MNYKIAQLAVSPEQKIDIASKIFISQPGLEEENLLGRLFVIAEFSSVKEETLKLVNFIIEQIKKNYYHNEQIILLEKTAAVKVENIFESAIAKLNQNLADFFQQAKIKFSSSDLNITIGVIFANELHFANLGRNRALLIYQPKKQAEKNYELIDITKKTSNLTQEIFNINKLFSNIVNGSLPIGSYFLFINEALFEYLSSQQLIKIITTLPPASAVEQIRTILQQTNIYVPFLGLIIKNGRYEPTAPAKPMTERIRARQTAGQPIQPRIYSLSQERDTIQALSQTEEKTARILNPSGLINFKSWKKFFNRLNLRHWKKQQTRNLTFRKKIALKPRLSLERLWRIVKLIFGWLLEAGLTFFKLAGWIIKKEKRMLAKEFILKQRRKMTRRHLIILIIISLTIIALTINLLAVRKHQRRQAAELDYQERLAAIQQKKGQITTDLIYDNLAGARQSLAEIEQLLADWPQETPEQIAAQQEFKASYNQQFDSLNQITRLNQPILTGSFNQEIKADNIVLAGQQLYAVDNSARQIYQLTPGDSTTALVSQSPLIKNLQSPVVDGNNNIYYLSNNNSIMVLEFGTKNIYNLQAQNLPDNMSALTIYENRLYVFSPADRQIYRFNRLNDSLTNRLAWLKETDLEKITSLSIDGFIYLISDRQIYQYGGGRRQSFDLDLIYPNLEYPDKIITLRQSDLLYILDKSRQRLVVFNKNGKFLAQYTSDLFDNLIDFTIDENAGQVYALNGRQVYSFEVFK